MSLEGERGEGEKGRKKGEKRGEEKERKEGRLLTINFHDFYASP